MGQNLRAKVFISCGQCKGTDEVTTAEEIAQRLVDKGFETYIAVEQQTLKGLKENIFNELSSSEYFLFIDFRREELAEGIHRGSLFCHQELAVASFLEIPLMAFREEGVKPDDGILKFIQANCESFASTDRHLLPDTIAGKIDQKGWKPNWKNQLVIEREPKQFIDAICAPIGREARYFHITVRNLNPYEHARNCYAFLKEARDLSTGRPLPLETAELKWAGYTLPNASIPPSSHRSIDGFFVFHSSPNLPNFSPFTDSTAFIPHIGGTNDYELIYMVVSDNFGPIEAKFRMHLADAVEKVTFKQIS